MLHLRTVFNHLASKTVGSCGLFDIQAPCTSRLISTSCPRAWILPRCRLRVIDNSELGKQAMLAGKPPYVIRVYRQGQQRTKGTRGHLGDKVLVALMGEMKRGFIVGQKFHRTQRRYLIPRTDTNNIVLLNDEGNPLGTRILLPIPGSLRKHRQGEISKILAIATKFV